jgi:Icc-related predicted phosphoesterase
MTTACILVSDLHGDTDRYEKLFGVIASEEPQAVFIGGDLLPSMLKPPAPGRRDWADFVGEYLMVELSRLRTRMGDAYPGIFVIMGNDDGRVFEPRFLEAEERGIWQYVHMKKASLARFEVYGYAYVPPTPFLLKDWERYDVSRFVDPGSIPPEEGKHSVPVDPRGERNATIREDLDLLTGDRDLGNAIMLFHTPPYNTDLDRAALDGKSVDHVPMDPHIGSIAVRRFIEARGPLVTLHGHVHESARLTGSWRDRIGRTHVLSAAHDGPELALVRFRPEEPGSAERDLI